jgi:hypothetical protein
MEGAKKRFSLTPKFDVSRNKPGYIYDNMREMLKVNMRYAWKQVGITALSVFIMLNTKFKLAKIFLH